MASEAEPAGPMALPSRNFSSSTLEAGLRTVDFQQLKQEPLEALEAKMKEPGLPHVSLVVFVLYILGM